MMAELILRVTYVPPPTTSVGILYILKPLSFFKRSSDLKNVDANAVEGDHTLFEDPVSLLTSEILNDFGSIVGEHIYKQARL